MAQSRRVVSKFNSRSRVADVVVADEKKSSSAVVPNKSLLHAVPKSTSAEVIRLYVQQDLTMASIAKSLHVSLKTVRNILRSNHITTRLWSRIPPLTPAHAARRISSALKYIRPEASAHQDCTLGYSEAEREALALAVQELNLALSMVNAEREGLEWNQVADAVVADEKITLPAAEEVAA
jgi:hypothetical protein